MKPPDVARREGIIDLLRERLSNVYGISGKRAEVIIDGLEENPQLLDSPQSLWYHILMMCRRVSAPNTYQLNNVLQGIYSEVGVAPQQVQMSTLPSQ